MHNIYIKFYLITFIHIITYKIMISLPSIILPAVMDLYTFFHEIITAKNLLIIKLFIIFKIP
ncbi:hypothetical protein EXM36_16595 [Clostridium botulinum]|uniref:Uncharacterized protein n=1 Tax=Clostridium botulinum TaxID=1491 RepID=A0A6B3YN45_CLOBO|nr:hypothetical protein RSJ13_12160 [Clostridium botulinum]AUN07584.1 hypothetical protein RSJ14_13130 [Clostridium botulinum]AUN18333.1 hypothetical protein B2M06_12300 [Clostridium botulinum]AXG94397.1 hypothetical protein AGE31_01345 [Clostridium botulinum]MBN3345889.1 hypothetical protein [Clostridium botulinum]